MRDRRGASARRRVLVTRASRLLATITAAGALVLAGAGSAAANTLCVNQHGTDGCYASITAAVTAASAGDVITVEHGTYNEHVTVTKSLSLIGDGKENTIIDATGKINGVTIEGTGTVVVSGFTVENADTAGIWITSSSDVTISDNLVRHNDLALNPAIPECPPLNGTPFQKGEAEDCGEGIFLSAVDHSLLANNTVTDNAGGILITDDTGPTHDNVITSNSVVRNTELDCGITMPSHNPISGGVFHNTVSDNDSSYNGGPGVGIFAPIPGTKAYGNVIAHNRLRGNGLPGVTMHNHVPNGTPNFPPFPAVFDDNVIVGNDISENAKDTDDAATSGPTGINIYSVSPMMRTVITQNVIHQEALDIVVKVPAEGPFAVIAHLNNLLDPVGVENKGAAHVDATMNWWGCSKGPGANGCSTISGTGPVLFTPWLTRPFQADGGK